MKIDEEIEHCKKMLETLSKTIEKRALEEASEYEVGGSSSKRREKFVPLSELRKERTYYLKRLEELENKKSGKSKKRKTTYYSF